MERGMNLGDRPLDPLLWALSDDYVLPPTQSYVNAAIIAVFAFLVPLLTMEINYFRLAVYRSWRRQAAKVDRGKRNRRTRKKTRDGNGNGNGNGNGKQRMMMSLEGAGGVVDSICQINGIVIQNALLCYCLYRT
jgi:hypothetical protein